nr:chemotaxis protein CheB [uncultured Brevundimonas sp.]
MSGGQAIVIGASAGAVQALLKILPPLSADYPLPIIIVVHVPPDRNNLLVPLLADRCRIRVKEAEDKEQLTPGVIYFAPSDYHLMVEADGALALSGEEPVNYSRPSIDVLFDSAADAYGAGLTGVILSGANDDGARGLVTVAARGGQAVVEDPEAAYASVMPTAALSLCATARKMTLDEIGAHLLELGKS